MKFKNILLTTLLVLSTKNFASTSVDEPSFGKTPFVICDNIALRGSLHADSMNLSIQFEGDISSRIGAEPIKAIALAQLDSYFNIEIQAKINSAVHIRSYIQRFPRTDSVLIKVHKVNINLTAQRGFDFDDEGNTIREKNVDVLCEEIRITQPISPIINY